MKLRIVDQGGRYWNGVCFGDYSPVVETYFGVGALPGEIEMNNGAIARLEVHDEEGGEASYYDDLTEDGDVMENAEAVAWTERAP
jgi:hypothetical protein